jgi:hypothetical protein
VADVRVLDELILEAGAFYVMDRASATVVWNRGRWRRGQASATIKSLGRDGLQSQALCYPDKLRRIHYVDPEADKINKSWVFLTNNFELPPLAIAG